MSLPNAPIFITDVRLEFDVGLVGKNPMTSGASHYLALIGQENDDARKSSYIQCNQVCSIVLLLNQLNSHRPVTYENGSNSLKCVFRKCLVCELPKRKSSVLSCKSCGQIKVTRKEY